MRTKAVLIFIPGWIKAAEDTKPTKQLEFKQGVKTCVKFTELIWFGSTFVPKQEPLHERKQRRNAWLKDRGYADDTHDWKDLMPTIVLYIFVFVSALRLFFSKHEASELFLYYNNYVHEPDEVK